MKTILLDTNALIALADPFHAIPLRLEGQIRQGAAAMTNSITWHEFVRGPMSAEDQARALQILCQRIAPVDREDAEVAAMLFNATGRRRSSAADCLIAASAIRRDAILATCNLDDFLLFRPYGLKLL